MQTDNKRLAKNTLILYVRTFILMGISLYTSREILLILGETDFGIYNLVGGVVVLFTFINSAMTGSTQRFITYAIGEQDEDKARVIFNESVRIHLIICGLIILLGETIGLWFVYYKLNIPPESRIAAMIVYQISLVNCCLAILKSPFNACIISYEKMSFFGYTSVIEGVLKLGLVFVLLAFSTNRLVFYALFMLGTSLILLIWYITYCRRKFPIIKYERSRNPMLMKKLLSFSGWSLFGSASVLGINQGVSIMLNIFFGVLINAAIGIANQVYGAVYTFVSNFQTAFVPQIVKTYASGEKEAFSTLMLRTSRFSLLLIAFFGIPIYFFADTILHWWLKDVPPFTTALVRIIILTGFFDALSGPLWASVQAKGKIKSYQIIVSLIFFLSLPLCFVLIKLGANEWQAFFAKLIMTAIAYFYRLAYNFKEFSLPVVRYFKDIFLRCGVVIAVTSILVGFIQSAVHQELIAIIVSFALTLMIISSIGINNEERKYIWGMVRKMIPA